MERAGFRGGYANRNSLAIDAKHPNRHRLLTDRNAYISYLEGLVERADVAQAEADACSKGLSDVRTRMVDLEDKVRIGTEASNANRQDMETRLLRLETLMGEARFAAEADVVRLRSETTTMVSDLAQRLENRMQTLSSFLDEGQANIIREAQAVCARLADDALAVAEEAKRGVGELERRIEVSLDTLRFDVSSARAAAASTSKTCSMPRADVDVLAEALERRLNSRLGQQVLQLSEVVRRVLQKQIEVQQSVQHIPGAQCHLQHSGPPYGSPASLDSPTKASPAGPGIATVAAPDACRAAIDDLYRELRQIEERNSIPSSGKLR